MGVEGREGGLLGAGRVYGVLYPFLTHRSAGVAPQGLQSGLQQCVRRGAPARVRQVSSAEWGTCGIAITNKGLAFMSGSGFAFGHVSMEKMGFCCDTGGMCGVKDGQTHPMSGRCPAWSMPYGPLLPDPHQAIGL